MSIEQDMAATIQLYMDAGPIDPAALAKKLNHIALQYKDAADKLAAQLSKLVGDETALTIPLSNGCTAKVRFSAEVTHETMQAFAKVFQAIADNYVVPEEQRGRQ